SKRRPPTRTRTLCSKPGSARTSRWRRGSVGVLIGCVQARKHVRVAEGRRLPASTHTGIRASSPLRQDAGRGAADAARPGRLLRRFEAAGGAGVRNGGADESDEQRGRTLHTRLVLRVELDAHEPRVRDACGVALSFPGQLDDLDEVLVGVDAGEHEAALAQLVPEGVVDLVAVAVALEDGLGAVDFAGERALAEAALVLPEAHGAALLGDLLLLGHQRDDRMRRVRVELGRVGVLPAADVAGELDAGDLHP